MITADDVLRVFPGAKIVSQPEHVGASLTNLFLTIKKGGIVQINITRSATKPRVTPAGRQQWGVLTQQFGDQQWVNLECDFRPMPGQAFDVNIVDKHTPDGRLFKNATIVGPAGNPPPPAVSRPVTSQPSALPPTQPAKPKISWGTWLNTISALAAAKAAMNLPDEGFSAIINTTLLTIKDERLEPPVADREPGQDDPFDWAEGK